MKKEFLNYGGLIMFYVIILVGVLLLNMRFSELNQYGESSSEEYILMTK